MTNFKRFAIIGIPGSGKSTFSTRLGQLLDIPVHHLDNHMFDGDVKRNKEDFLTVKNKILAQEFWIIEGCSLSTLEMRFQKADAVIYFNLPRLVCLYRSVRRFFSYDDYMASTGCLKGINWMLTKYIWNFDQKSTADIRALSKKYPQVQFLEFSNSKMAEEYLKQIKY